MTGRIIIDTVDSGGDQYLTLECQHCPWINEITAPVDLDVINDRAHKHQEVCAGE